MALCCPLILKVSPFMFCAAYGTQGAWFNKTAKVLPVKKFIYILGFAATPKKETKKFECPTCGKKFALRNTLNAHKRLHKQNHQCEICLKYFRCKSKLDDHLRVHTGEKPFECPVCGKCFAHKSNLNAHQKTHDSKKSLKCPVCPEGRFFRTNTDLAHHMAFHYEPKHACVKCGEKFHRSSDLDRHLLFHFQPAYECDKCGRMFHTPGILNKHKAVHSKPKHVCWNAVESFTVWTLWTATWSWNCTRGWRKVRLSQASLRLLKNLGCFLLQLESWWIKIWLRQCFIVNLCSTVLFCTVDFNF